MSCMRKEGRDTAGYFLCAISSMKNILSSEQVHCDKKEGIKGTQRSYPSELLPRGHQLVLQHLTLPLRLHDLDDCHRHPPPHNHRLSALKSQVAHVPASEVPGSLPQRRGSFTAVSVRYGIPEVSALRRCGCLLVWWMREWEGEGDANVRSPAVQSSAAGDSAPSAAPTTPPAGLFFCAFEHTQRLVRLFETF